jgi:hypothetical protein
MALPDIAQLSRLGQVNGAGAVDALMYQKFTGEVLTAFREKTIMMGRHKVRTIPSGKSAGFPVTWKATAKYHVVGTSILQDTTNNYLNEILQNERVIGVDARLVSPVFIGDVDEAMNEWEVRSEFAQQLGFGVANKFDAQVLKVVALTAAAAATITGGNGGGTAIEANMFGAVTPADGAADTVAAIRAARAAFANKDVPSDELYMACTPDDYYWMVENLRDYIISTDYRGYGSVADGEVKKIMGFTIVPTTHFPADNIAAETGVSALNTYDGNFTTLKSLFWHKSAVGTVKLRDVSTESEYSIEYQGTLMNAKLLCGHGILRPESAYSVTNA